MPSEPGNIEGYAPSPKELLKSLGIHSPNEMRKVVLDRCRDLYKKAETEGKIMDFGTPYNFIVCKSIDFFEILTKMSHGSAAMVVKDDLGPEAFFLMFGDKIPKQFYPIAAVHEATEYNLRFLERMDQLEAHKAASAAELQKAEDLHLEKRYAKFLKSKYPGKYQEMLTWVEE